MILFFSFPIILFSLLILFISLPIILFSFVILLFSFVILLFSITIILFSFTIILYSLAIILFSFAILLFSLTIILFSFSILLFSLSIILFSFLKLTVAPSLEKTIVLCGPINFSSRPEIKRLINVDDVKMHESIFGMAAMPFLYNGTWLFQGNSPRVLPVTIFKYASSLIPYIGRNIFVLL